MASNLPSNKPEISCPASKKLNFGSSSDDTPGQSSPIQVLPPIAADDLPLTLAKLLKGHEQEPHCRDLGDQILNHPAYIQYVKHLENQRRALSGDNPPEFDAEACASSCKLVLDNPGLMAIFKRFKTVINELLPMMLERSKAHIDASPSDDIIRAEFKITDPATRKRNLTKTESLQNMVKKCRLVVESSVAYTKEHGYKYELVPGVNINVMDKWERTALHFACAKGKVFKAKFLIDNGADMDRPDDQGNTALHYAAGYGKEQCVRLMLEHGANTTLKNSFGDTPYGIAELNDQTSVMDLIKKMLKNDV